MMWVLIFMGLCGLGIVASLVMARWHGRQLLKLLDEFTEELKQIERGLTSSHTNDTVVEIGKVGRK